MEERHCFHSRVSKGECKICLKNWEKLLAQESKGWIEILEHDRLHPKVKCARGHIVVVCWKNKAFRRYVYDGKKYFYCDVCDYEDELYMAEKQNALLEKIKKEQLFEFHNLGLNL